VQYTPPINSDDMTAPCSERGKIHRVEDLESIFAIRVPVAYLIKPELPAKAIVCLTGDAESGKTTLACAWAREALRLGHPVLILDRDRNPRDRICERLERLGIKSDGDLLRVWDCEQQEDVPQPDHPIITDWASRMAESGKSPLLIVDSLVSFFRGDEDENCAVDMRALFNRCRTLTKLGATVIIIHHTNRNGETRGSSDFKPASDQAFLVTNQDRDGGRLLDVITLKCEKSRYGLSSRIQYHYAGGQMRRVEGIAPSKAVSQTLRELLIASPGVSTEAFERLAGKNGVGRNKARDFLQSGVQDGTIEVRTEGRKHRHFWRDTEAAFDHADPEGNLECGGPVGSEAYPPPPSF
jgi:KaiC/GvpD/RAD55 family RecA-like ATPase